MFLKTFIFILGVAFVVANPIQKATETKVEKDSGLNVIEVDESKNSTSTQDSSSTEQVTEEEVGVTTEQQDSSSTEQVTEEEVEVTTEQQDSSSTEQVTEEEVEVTTEQPEEDQSAGEKIKNWLDCVKQKLKEEWEVIKNILNHLVH